MLLGYDAGWDVRFAGYDPTTGCIDRPESEWPEFEARLRLPTTRQGCQYVRGAKSGEPVGDAYYEDSTSGAASIGITIVPARSRRATGDDRRAPGV